MRSTTTAASSAAVVLLRRRATATAGGVGGSGNSATTTAPLRRGRPLAAAATFSSSSSSPERSVSGATGRSIKSLALSVHFKQPDFGMKEYEVLSRASAFLLAVDPPSSDGGGKDGTDAGPYGHLAEAEQRRKDREYRRGHNRYSPAGGPGRNVMELGWLEFVPREVRPKVHVACASHVVSPFLWKNYYPQDWLSRVRQEHCAYALEVYGRDDEDEDGGVNSSRNPKEPIAKLALNPEPFHHPEGRDVALLHFRDEDSSLKLLKRVGVDLLRLRHPDKLYRKGEEMTFDGFVVSERNPVDDGDDAFDDNGGGAGGPRETSSATTTPASANEEEDSRIFYPYRERGNLAFHTDDRFFATTPDPLPEGLCGAPVLDADDDLCGVVEGIVPVDHKDVRLAGSAAFMPSHVMKVFVDYVERGLLERMMPKDLFQMVVTAKKTNALGGGVFKADKDGNFTDPSDWEEAHDLALKSLEKRYSEKEVDAILETIRDERDEIMEIFDKEGGDLDEIIRRVRHKTLQIREMVRDQYAKGLLKLDAGEGKDGSVDDDDASEEKKAT